MAWSFLFLGAGQLNARILDRASSSIFTRNYATFGQFNALSADRCVVADDPLPPGEAGGA